MSGLPIGFLIESVVSVLLVITIGYCYILNKRLIGLKADKDTMRDMISDLVEATTMANSAIGQLREVAGEADTALNSRLEEAERFTMELANHVVAGQGVIKKISQITDAVRQSETGNPVKKHRAGVALEQLEKHERRRGRAA